MTAVAEAPRRARTSAAAAWNLLLGLLVVAALIVQVVLSARQAGQPVPTRFIRLVSFFTVQSNILVAVSALTLARHPDRDGRLWRVLRLDALIGIAVTGVVYSTVLATQESPTGWAAVTNAVFHYAVPLGAVIGWLAFGPRPRIDARTLARALAWPLAWFGYTLLHGHFTHWYPYPFVNVVAHGYGTVLLNALAATAVLAAVGACFLAGDRYLRW
jgi:hypothetical protein